MNTSPPEYSGNDMLTTPANTYVAERRKHPRFNCDIQIQGVVSNAGQEEIGPLVGANLLNVSQGCIALVSDQPLEVGCYIEVTGDKAPRRNQFAASPRFVVLQTIETNDQPNRYISRCQIIDGEVPTHWMHQHTPDRNH